MAERTGLEPATPGVTGRYSNQLNYRSTQKADPSADILEPKTLEFDFSKKHPTNSKPQHRSRQRIETASKPTPRFFQSPGPQQE